METRERSREQLWEEVLLLRKKLARAESRCRQAEEANGRLAAALELTDEATCVLDHKGRLLFLNAAGRTTLGLPDQAPEDMAKAFLSLYTQTGRETLVTKGIPLATQDGRWEGPVAFRHKTQHEVTFSQHLRAHRTAHGSLFFASVLRSQAGTQKAATQEKALAREELQQLYGELAKDLPVGMGVWQQENHGTAASHSFRLVAVNDLTVRLLGVPMRVGDTVSDTDALTSSGKKDFGDFLAETLRTGRVLTIPRFRPQPEVPGELTIRAFPLGTGGVGVFFQPAPAVHGASERVAVEKKRDEKEAEERRFFVPRKNPEAGHPLLDAMTSATSFAFCLASKQRRAKGEASPKGAPAMPEWAFDYVSKGLSHALGCRPEDLVGSGVLSLCVHDDSSQGALWSLSAAMSEGRECGVSVVLRTSPASSLVRCRLWASPLNGGAAYLLFYSQFKEEADRPGSPAHILSFTEDEDVFCRIFDSLTVGMILWRMEEPNCNDDRASSPTPASIRGQNKTAHRVDGAPATGGRPRFRLLAVNKKAHSFNLGGTRSVGCYFDELTPELVETGLLEAYVQILSTGQPGPLGLIPLRHEGYKECNLVATGFPVSSTLLAVLFEEIPAGQPSTSQPPPCSKSEPARPGSRPSSPPRPLSPSQQQQSQHHLQPGPTLPPLLSRKRNRTCESDTFTGGSCSEKADDDVFHTGHRLPHSSGHPFVRVPTPFKRQRGSAFTFGELPSPSSLIEPKGMETGVGVWWEWCRSSPVACVVLEVQGDDGCGRITQTNEAFGDMVGYPSERLLGAAFSLVCPDSERKVAAIAAAEGSAVKHGEATYRSRCGQNVACVESMWSLPRGRIGLLVQPIAALRERFPSALDDRIFQRCFAAAPSGVGLLGKEGRLLEANYALHSLLGHRSGELIGQTFHAFIQPEDVEGVLSLPYRMVHSGLPSTQLLVRCRRRDGASLLCLLCLSLINDASTGTTTHLLLNLQSMEALESIFRSV